MSQSGQRKNNTQSYSHSYSQKQYQQQYQQPQQSYIHTYSPIQNNSYNPNAFSSYTIQQTPRQYQNQHRAISSNQVSQLTGQKIRQGSVVKGRSRIQYVPFQKKVTDYQTRTIKQMIPKPRKVTQYQQRKYYENVPREVIKQQFIAVQKITQYIKQIIPQKYIQQVAVQRKIKKIQYVPVQKQIVHYPKNQQFMNIQGKSRLVLQSQGVLVSPNAQYKPIQSDLLYKFTNNAVNPNTPIGYVDLGSRRYLSTAPTQSNTNLGYQNVQSVSRQDIGMNPYQYQNDHVAYEGGKSFINDFNLNTAQFRGNNNGNSSISYNQSYVNNQIYSQHQQNNINNYQHQNQQNNINNYQHQNQQNNSNNYQHQYQDSRYKNNNNGSTTRSINQL